MKITIKHYVNSNGMPILTKKGGDPFERFPGLRLVYSGIFDDGIEFTTA
jgi:hypothetical protein